MYISHILSLNCGSSAKRLKKKEKANYVVKLQRNYKYFNKHTFEKDRQK